MNKISRRGFLIGAVAAGGGLLAACAPRVIETEVLVPGESVEVTRVVEVPGESVEVEKEVIVSEIVERVVGEPSWTAPDFAGREYLIWGLQYDPHIEAYQRLADHFEAHTGAVATIEPQGWPIETNVITGIAAGIVPDVVCIMGKQIVPLIKEDAILAIDDLVYDAVGVDVDTWFGPVGLQAYQYDGKTYGVPTEGNCVSGITNARHDFIDECSDEIRELWPPNVGLDGFRGFEEMWTLAEAMQRSDDEGVTRWGLSSRGWDNRHLFGIMRTLGRDWWDPSNRTFALTSDEAYEAMFLQVVEPVFNRGIEAEITEACTNAQTAGKVALACGNVTQPAILYAEGIPGDNCVYPSAIPGRDALFVGEGGWGFVAPSSSDNPDIGVEFLKFLTTYEGQKEYARIYGAMVSACNAVNSDPELFPEGDPIAEALKRGAVAQKRTVYYGSGFGNPSEMEGIVSTAITNVRTGLMGTDEALTEAQALLEEMLAREDAEA